jgi:hypothetical protein
MTHVDSGHFRQGNPRVHAAMYDVVNSWFGRLQRVGRGEYIDFDHERASYQRPALEQRLVDFQTQISGISRHLPKGFATGLNRQFANMFDDDAWEAEDEFPALPALTTFLTMLIRTQSNRRPGIGTNGRGSITAFWKEGENRLTIECYAGDRVKWVLTRLNERGTVERAAGDCITARLLEVLRPYEPGIWFGQ